MKLLRTFMSASLLLVAMAMHAAGAPEPVDYVSVLVGDRKSVV